MHEIIGRLFFDAGNYGASVTDAIISKGLCIWEHLFSSVAVVRHVVEDIFFSLNNDVTVDKEMAEVIGNWNWGYAYCAEIFQLFILLWLLRFRQVCAVLCQIFLSDVNEDGVTYTICCLCR